VDGQIYFLSDTHFTYHRIGEAEKKKRQRFLAFLQSIHGSRGLFLVGDIFDFWFEYGSTIPKYYHDILDGLHSLRKSGTPIYITGGNHDYWLGRYISEHLGCTILPPLSTHTLQGRTVTLTHGDMLLPGDYGYKALKACIRSKPVVAVARLVHPDILYSLARRFSKVSKSITHKKTIQSARTLAGLAERSFFRWGNDVFVMGHIHYPQLVQFGDKVFVILGDWEVHSSYLRLDGGRFTLEFYGSEEKTVIENR
jgi:UDP-2,3-diacylglucosamine hydrolase